MIRLREGEESAAEELRHEIESMEALRGAPNIVGIEDYALAPDGSAFLIRMELLHPLSESYPYGRKYCISAAALVILSLASAVCVSADGVISFSQNYLWLDGKPGECTAAVTDGDYTIKSVVWSVMGDAVSVDANGKVTALKAGTGCVVALYTYDVEDPGDGEENPGTRTVTATANASIEVKQNALLSITAMVKSTFVDKQAIRQSDFEVIGYYADGETRPITDFTIDKTETAAPVTEVTISAGGIATKITIPVTKIDPENLVKSIEISEPAANTEYKAGDKINTTDVELKVTDIYGGVSYKKVDGTSVKWNLTSGTSYTFSNDDAKTGYKSIKVAYAGQTASVNVKVTAAAPEESTFAITYTAGTTAKTTFLVGDKFDGTGYKFKITENGKDITSKCSNLKITAYTFDEDDVGKKVSIDLNASFTYNDKTEKATITITGLTVLEEAEELDIYEIDTVVLKSDKYAVGYEFDPDKLENDVDYIKVVLYEDRKTSKTTKIYADDFDEYDNDFALVVLDANGKAKSSRNRHTIEEDDVYTKSGKDMVHLLFTADTETFAIEVSVGDSGVKFYYDGELITSYDYLEDALYYTTRQDRNVDTDDFDLDDLRESKPIVLKLGEDKKVSSTFDFDPEHNIEIDLNGHSLTFYTDTIDISRDNKNYTVTIKNTSAADATFIYYDKKVNITLKKGDTLFFEYGNDLPGFITVTVAWDKNGFITEKTNNIKTVTTTSGEIQIGKGTTLTFTIRPNTGYEIKSVTVDGVSVTSSAYYTVNSTGTATYMMTNITKNCTLAVTFTEKQAPSAVRVALGNAYGTQEQRIRVPVILTDNAGFTGLSLDVAYDPAILTLTEVSDTGLLPGAAHSGNLASPCPLTWDNDLAKENITVKGTAAYLIFTVKPDAPAGTTPLTLSVPADGIIDARGAAVPYSLTNAEVTVTDYMIGDVDSDREVTPLDRMILARYLARWVEYTADMVNAPASDVNLDGALTNKDRMILARYLAGWEDYEDLPVVGSPVISETEPAEPEEPEEPAKPMTRAEIAMKLVDVLGLEYTPDMEVPFPDVSPDDPWYQAVAICINKSLFNGISSTRFAPENTMTRAMIAVVFCRAGLTRQEYADLPEDLIGMENSPQYGYAAPYIPTDLYYGIMWAKSDGLFHPNDAFCENEADWERFAELIPSEKTGFSVLPEAFSPGTVSLETNVTGKVQYYYTKSSAAPSVSEFNTNYNSAASRYKGTKAAGSYSYSYIDYDQSIAASYPYMVLMFTDGTKQYSPVIVELDAVSRPASSPRPMSRTAWFTSRWKATVRSSTTTTARIIPAPPPTSMNTGTTRLTTAPSTPTALNWNSIPMRSGTTSTSTSPICPKSIWTRQISKTTSPILMCSISRTPNAPAPAPVSLLTTFTKSEQYHRKGDFPQVSFLTFPSEFPRYLDKTSRNSYTVIELYPPGSYPENCLTDPIYPIKLQEETAMKRKLSLFLALWMLLAAACAETAEQETEPAADAPSAETEEAAAEETVEVLKDNLPDADLNGYAYRVCAPGDNHAETIVVEELTGNNVKDAVFQKVQNVEERFNCDVSLAELGKSVANVDTTDYLKQDILAGNDSFDIVQGHDVNMANVSLEGCFLNLYEIPHLDFEQPWWPAPTVNSMTVNGQMYLMSNNISYVSTRSIRVMYFNKGIFDSLGMAYPYESVYEGTYTLDSLADMAEAGYQDLNGDGAMDDGDIFGILNPKYFYCVLEPFNIEPYTKDESGSLMYSFDVEKAQTITEKLYNLFFSSFGQLNGNAITMFSEGKSMFLYETLDNAVTTFSQGDTVYGILPMPKVNESDEGYYGGTTDRPMAIPTTAPADNWEAIGIITEAMNFEGYRTVFPVYYEVALKSRYADQTDDAKMIDIVHENCICSFTYMFGDYASPYNNMLDKLFNAATPTTDVASYAAGIEKVQNARIKRIMKFYGAEE